MAIKQLKVDEQGNAVLQDGHPVYVWEDGKEAKVDVVELFNKTLPGLRNESKEHREKAENALNQLKVLDGIEKPEEFIVQAKQALETVKNLDQKQLIAAGEVEKLKAQVAQGYEEKIKALTDDGLKRSKKLEDEVQAKETIISDLLIDQVFMDSSNWLIENTLWTPSIAKDVLRRFFTVETDKEGKPVVVAKHRSGDRILSRTNPTEFADPREAVEILIGEHPDKDHILKAKKGGSGTPSEQMSSGKISMTLAEWQAKIASAQPEEERELFKKLHEGVITIRK